jgi:hypothetical protein
MTEQEALGWCKDSDGQAPGSQRADGLVGRRLAFGDPLPCSIHSMTVALANDGR